MLGLLRKSGVGGMVCKHVPACEYLSEGLCVLACLLIWRGSRLTASATVDDGGGAGGGGG